MDPLGSGLFKPGLKSCDTLRKDFQMLDQSWIFKPPNSGLYFHIFFPLLM